MSDEQAMSQFTGEIKGICEAMDIKDYQAFPRWICDNILGIRRDSMIDDAIAIGGSNDYGIDIFYMDDESDSDDQYVCLGQIKFSKTLDYRVTREEILSFKESIKYLENCPDDANSAFKQKANEFRMIKQDNPDIRIIMLFAVTGSLNEQAKVAIRQDLDQIAIDNGSKPDIRILDMSEIMSHIITPRTPDIRIGFDNELVHRLDPVTHKKSILGYVNAKDLMKTIKPHKGSVYLENPREYLGEVSSTNKEIMSTICDVDLRKKFWKLNNGITAICNEFEPDVQNPTIFTVKNFKVVNGRQTTSTMERSTVPLDDVFVLLTIHEVANPEEHNLISQTTNTQNPIKPLDLITNTLQLRDLVLQCRHDFKEFYFERQTRGFNAENSLIRNRVTPRRILDKNNAARAYYAYAIDPNDAILSDREMFSTTEPIYFNRVFQGRRIKELIIPHIFITILDELRDNWKKVAKDQNPSISYIEKSKTDPEIFSKRITKYFVLRFIGMSMASMGEKQRHSVEEKIIEIFRSLKKKDKIPEPMLNVVEIACGSFMVWFHARWRDTWPSYLAEKRSELGYKKKSGQVPTPYEIMYQLKKNGETVLNVLEEEREYKITIGDSQDVLVSALQELEKYEAPN